MEWYSPHALILLVKTQAGTNRESLWQQRFAKSNLWPNRLSLYLLLNKTKQGTQSNGHKQVLWERTNTQRGDLLNKKAVPLLRNMYDVRRLIYHRSYAP